MNVKTDKAENFRNVHENNNCNNYHVLIQLYVRNGFLQFIFNLMLYGNIN